MRNSIIRENLEKICEEIARRYTYRDRSGCQCPCHMWVFAGIPCPPDCPDIFGHFDGCHECDCKSGKHYFIHRHPELFGGATPVPRR